jgi:hypothetical protein
MHTLPWCKQDWWNSITWHEEWCTNGDHNWKGWLGRFKEADGYGAGGLRKTMEKSNEEDRWSEKESNQSPSNTWQYVFTILISEN